MLYPHTITNIKAYKVWLWQQIQARVPAVMETLERLALEPDTPPNDADNFHARRQGAVRVAVRYVRRQREMEGRVYKGLKWAQGWKSILKTSNALSITPAYRNSISQCHLLRILRDWGPKNTAAGCGNESSHAMAAEETNTTPSDISPDSTSEPKLFY